MATPTHLTEQPVQYSGIQVPIQFLTDKQVGSQSPLPALQDMVASPDDTTVPLQQQSNWASILVAMCMHTHIHTHTHYTKKPYC